MSVYFPSQSLEPIGVKLSTTNATVIAGDANSRTLVDWFQCTEIAGSTPTLTIELYDGTTSYYLRKATAMAANEEVLRTQSIALNPGWYLRITASAANQVDVTGQKVVVRP